MGLEGIFLGLAAATCQSFSYFASRWFLSVRQSGVTGLFLASHLLMGALSFLAFPFVEWSMMPSPENYLTALAGSAGFYLLGQAALLSALKKSESSRIAPLLGLKLVVLAGISSVWFKEDLLPGQWAAVAMSVLAALLLGGLGPAIALQSAVWVVAACLAYSFSDLCISALVRRLAPLDLSRASFAGVVMSYAFCGVAVTPFMLARGQTRPLGGDMLASAPYSFLWFVGMLFLYACFGTVGPVYGNILQSTRGVISVLVGLAVASLGFANVEKKFGISVWAVRLGAAVLMALAVWLYHSA